MKNVKAFGESVASHTRIPHAGEKEENRYCCHNKTLQINENHAEGSHTRRLELRPGMQKASRNNLEGLTQLFTRRNRSTIQLSKLGLECGSSKIQSIISLYNCTRAERNSACVCDYLYLLYKYYIQYHTTVILL